MAYNATTGARLWARSYQGPGMVSVPEATPAEVGANRAVTVVLNPAATVIGLFLNEMHRIRVRSRAQVVT